MCQFWRLYNLEKLSYINITEDEQSLGDDVTRIITKLRRNRARDSWAGDRIICFGSYATSVPEGVMTDEEIERLKAKGEDLDLDCPELHDVLKEVCSKEQVPPLAKVDYSNYVLRNLSKKAFIRGNGRYQPFGEMLFANICWSDDASVELDSSNEIVRGEWAGDRLDVVTFKSVRDVLNKDGWVDCTEDLNPRGDDHWVHSDGPFYDY